MSSWEWQADRWLAWARAPGHDSYRLFRDSFFDAIVPAPGQLTLEVGCGEGRVARDLTRLGHTVVAPDASPTLVAKAAGRHRFEEAFERDGLQITFSGWRYSLEEYARAPEEAGLLVERLREPPAPAAALTARPGYERWQRLPNFLHFRAVKR
jgi:SAM-dependent methyltransferase